MSVNEAQRPPSAAPPPSPCGDLLLPLAAFVSAAGLTALLLVWLQVYEPWLALAVGLGGAFLLRQRCRLPSLPLLVTVLLLVGLHLALRLPTFPHYEGGQDQGVYFNWSRVISREKAEWLCDPLSPGLQAAERELYDAGGGFEVPGLVPASPGSDCFRLQFYPLASVWLALGGAVAGFDHRGLALTFFSLVFLAAVCRLVSLQTHGETAAVAWAAVLVSVNPGLVFIARFPLSEMAAGATLMLTLALLATAWERARRGGELRLPLVLSVATFACYVLTRASFLFVLPFFLALAVGVQLYVHRPRIRRPLLATLLACLGICACVLTYYTVSNPLGFGYRLQKTVGDEAPWLGAALVVGAAAFYLCGRYRGSALLRRVRWELSRWHRPLLFTLLLVAFLLHLSAVWARLIVQPLAGGLYATPGGFPGLGRAQLFRALVYVTPLGAALLLAGLAVRSGGDRRRRTLALGALLSVLFMLHFTGITWSSYSYYYDRYVLSELVPLGLVALALVTSLSWLHRPRLHRWTQAGLAAIVAWSLIGSLVLRGDVEGSGPAAFDEIADLARGGISGEIGGRSLVLVDRSTIRHPEALLTGLRLEKGLEVFPLHSRDLLEDPTLRRLRSREPRTLLVTGEPPVAATSYRYVTSVVRVRSFFSGRSRHMLDLLTASSRRVERSTRAALLPSLQLWLPPLKHTTLEEKLLIYESVPAGGRASLRFEAEDQPTTLPPNRVLDVNEPLALGGNGRARRVGAGGAAGAVVFGPYVSADQGAYTARFWMRSEDAKELRLKVDAVSQVGSCRHAERLVDASELSGRRYSPVDLEFVLAAGVDDLELRLWTFGGGTLWLDRVDLHARGPEGGALGAPCAQDTAVPAPVDAPY